METDEYSYNLDEFIKNIDDDKQFNFTCLKISEDVRSSKLTLLDLVEKLETLLINTSVEKRERGLSVLTKVLECLANDFLNSSQVKFISDFYADRLKDHHQIVPIALRGILRLIDFDNYTEGNITKILQNLFQHVSCQQQQQADRLIIYNIFEKTLDKRLSEIQSMSFDYVYGVITAVDGERDPRNLLYLFEWLPKFIKSVNLGHLIEEMFEVVACYFPVDFKASSDEIKGITRDALAEALCPCLCCIPEFSQFCIPLALEKLSSSLRIAKIDSLNLLIKSCDSFSAEDFFKHSAEIWSLLQKEIFSNTDQFVLQKTLNALTCVLHKLSLSPTHSDQFSKIVKDLIDTVKGNLIPDAKLFSHSTRILLHVAKASEKSAYSVTTEIVPQLLNTYNITTNSDNQAIILDCLVNFVLIYIEMSGNSNVSDIKQLSFVPHLFLKASINADPKIRSVGLNNIAVATEIFSKDLRQQIYDNLRVYLVTYQEPEVRRSVIKCFRNFCKLFPLEIEEEIFCKMKINDANSLDLYLDCLSEVELQQNKLVEKILNTYKLSLSNSKNLNELCIVVNSLKKVVDKNKENVQVRKFLWSSEGIVDIIINFLSNNFDNSHVQQFEKLARNVVEILEILMGNETAENQLNILQKYLPKIIHAFKSTKSSIYVVFLHGFLCRLKSAMTQEYNEDLVRELCETSLHSKDDLIFELGANLLANILNKLVDNQILDIYLKVIENSLEIDKKFNTRNLIFFSLISKALIIKGHEYGSIYLTKLLDMLELHIDVAKGFQVIMNDKYSCLNGNSYCKIRLLYKQKFFTEIIERICSQEKEQYLLSLGYILMETPKQVIVMHFKKILKNLILCLEKIENPDVLCPILDILFHLIGTNQSVLEDYIQEFVPRLINLTHFEKSMKVRVKALQCLQAYTSGYSIHKLLLFKQNVVYELLQCLDDPKRMVRKEAVLTRNCWFLLDSPT